MTDQIKMENKIKDLLTGFAGFFPEGNINQRYGNNSQKSSNLRLSDLWSEINHSVSAPSWVRMAKYKNNITATRFNVKVNGSLVPNIATIQTTTKFEQIEEKTLSRARVGLKDIFTNYTLPNYA